MILIADLNGKRSAALAQLISVRLKQEVHCIHSAHELVRGVKFSALDLMILNPKLPDLGTKCYDLIRKIRTTYHPLTLPIMLLGDKEWKTITVSGFAAGANDILQMPLDEHVTLSRIKRQLDNKALFAEARAGGTQRNHGAAGVVPAIDLHSPERNLDKPIPCEIPLSLVTRTRSFFCKTIWISYRRLLLRAFEDVPREKNYRLEIPNPNGGKIDLDVVQISREAIEQNVAGVFKMSLEITHSGDGYEDLFAGIQQQHQVQETISRPLPVTGEKQNTVVFSSQDVALDLIKGSRYKFRRYLGKGSFASVYLVDDLALKRPVAMKVLAPDFSKAGEARMNFLNEAQIAAQFHHANVVFVFEVGEIGEENYHRHLHFPAEILKKHPHRLIYFTMQYVEGQTLSRWIDGRQQPEPACLEIMIKIARALAFAHGKDVIHRDIKPDNIMVTPEEEVLVADFGIATLVRTSRETAEGKFEIACTPKYASPEQLSGEPVDHRSDLYSFGIVAYELLAGHAPFTGRSITEIAAKQLSAVAPELQALRPDLSPKLEAIVRRCMEKKPEDRYQKASDLLSDLLAFKGSKEKVDSGSAAEALESLLAQAIVAATPAEAGQVLERIVAFLNLRQTHEDVEELRTIHQKLTDPNLINILIEKNLTEENLQLLYQFFMMVESSSAVSRILRWFQKESDARRKEFLGQLAVLCAGEDLMPLVAFGLELGDKDARLLLKSFGDTAGHHAQPIFLKWALHSGYQTQRELIKIITTTKRSDFEVFGILEYYASGKGTIHREIKELAGRLVEEKQMY